MRLKQKNKIGRARSTNIFFLWDRAQFKNPALRQAAIH
jgi:hypothetical protein